MIEKAEVHFPERLPDLPNEKLPELPDKLPDLPGGELPRLPDKLPDLPGLPEKAMKTV